LNTLAARIRSNPDINIHSILIVKDDKLVFEEYFSGKDEDWGTDLGVVEFNRHLRRQDCRGGRKRI
jgi:hypothetical protein